MKQICFFLVLIAAVMEGGAYAQVVVSSPATGALVSSPVSFVASATSSNSAYPITAMRIYADNTSMYTVYAATLSTSLALSAGGHTVTIVAWDASGQAYTKSLSISVGSPGNTGVIVTSPAAGTTLASPVQFVASATSSNSAYPITAMRIYADNTSMYTVYAATLNTSLALSAGGHTVTIVAWDASGQAYMKALSISVATVTAGGVSITAPVNGSSVLSPVAFVASAHADSGSTIAAMRIYVDNASEYTVNAASLSTSLSLASGTHNVVVQAWDNLGTVYKSAETINVSAPQSITHSVTLDWTASTSSGVIGYNVYRGIQSGGPYTKISTAPQPGTSYADLAVVSGTTYYYVVTAVNGSGQESAYSTQVAATIP